MGSILGDLPSHDPHNFSQLRPSDPSNPSQFLLGMPRIPKSRPNNEILLWRVTPVIYRPTHNRTLPPPDQVIATEAKNILIRSFYQRAEEKLRPKRAAYELLTPEHGSKQLRAST